MVTLRTYQNKAIDDIKNAFLKGYRHLILQAPTGSGKTIIFSEIAKKMAEKNNKILILTDRVELLMQAGGSLRNAGLNSFYIQAGTKVYSNYFNSYIAMSQTFRRRINELYWKGFLQNIDLLIIDEVHKQEFNYLFESGLVDNKFIIGFTATPKRTGNMRQLAIDFDKIITTVSVKWLIDHNYLVNDDYYGIESPDLSDVKYNYMKGDYDERSLFQKFNTPQLYSGVVKNYEKLVPDTKTLVFCVNIEHTIKTVLEFQNNGIDARFIVSGISAPKKPKETDTDGKKVQYEERMRIYNLYKSYFNLYSGKRDEIFKDFKDGKFSVLVNAGIATTGYDCPSIETIILNRATSSTTLLLQMIGRGSRIHKTKTHFNILDFGGNCQRLGYYSEDRDWFLWHEKRETKGLPPMKECGFTLDGKPIKSNKKNGCRRLILASYKICPFCGFKYPSKKNKDIDLETYMYDGQKALKIKNIRDMNYEELYGYWKIKRHKTAWLWRQLWYRNKDISIQQFGRKYGWSYSTIKKAVSFCENFQ